MQKISRTFKVALKLDSRPAYQIAQQADVDPNWLSKAIIGAISLRENDTRLQRVAEVLGLSHAQIFEGGNHA